MRARRDDLVIVGCTLGEARARVRDRLLHGVAMVALGAGAVLLTVLRG
jgi:hypothetical protein